MRAIGFIAVCLSFPEALHAKGLAESYPMLMSLQTWEWMLLSLGFHVASALVVDWCSRVFFPHLKILGDKRRQPRTDTRKVAILFALNSMQTGLILWLSLYLQTKGWGKLYALESLSIGQLARVCLEVVFILFILDTQYYWLHRLFHSHPKLYRIFHAGHHEARHPTVWHLQHQTITEMFLATTLPMLLLAILPIPLSLPAYLGAIIMGAFINVAGHAGYEITATPLGAASLNGWAAFFDKDRKGLARIFNNVLHHDLHHQRVRVNYSLYFTFWDRLTGTMDPDSDQTHKFIKNPTYKKNLL